jgi:WD40 repeat protein/energy-coupling factor transporter ATP-binding protein EcfA2
MDDALLSLQRQLVEAEENLRLVQQRIAEYVFGTDVPLQLVKQEQQLKATVADLQKQLAQLSEATPAAQPGRPEPEPRLCLAETPCPYRGLEPFEAEHAAFYFGRQAMVERLLARLKECAFVAVVGPSGSGKSSLVRAGLVAALREDKLPGSRHWLVRFFRPGADPLRALAIPLAALLEPVADDIDRIAQIRKLADYLREDKFSLADVVAQMREKNRDLPHLILIADQFEELYTECQDAVLRQAFVRTLLSGKGEPNLTLALTLRADFYGHALADRGLGEAVDAGLVNVLPMSPDELRAAIEQPAKMTHRAFEPGLVDLILKDVAEQPGNLPLLEFALAELWQRQTPEGGLTLQAYGEIGGVAGAIARRADAIYQELDGRGQGAIAQRIFLRLTHYGEGAEDTRRRVVEADLVTPGAPVRTVRQVVRTLADARLLVTARDQTTQAATVEVAHEAVIRGWERLRRWLDEDRAFGLWRERLTLLLHIWEEAQCSDDALLRGAPLSEAEGWLNGRSDDLNEAECAFIRASLALREREEAEREARQRRELEAAQRLAEEQRLRAEERTRAAVALRRRALWLGIALILTVIAGMVAVWFGVQATSSANAARRESDINAARAFKARALVQLPANAECALALSLAAYDRAISIPNFPRYEFEDVARQTLLQTHVEATLVGHTASVNGVAWAPDGQRIASAGEDGTVWIWDTSTGENTLTLAVSGENISSYAMAWNPDGRQLAAGYGDGAIRLWDANTGKMITTLSGHSGQINDLKYSPDGNTLASASRDKTVRLWDVRTGKILFTLNHSDLVTGIAWGPGGRQVATAAYYGVKLWDTATGEFITGLETPTYQNLSVSWSPGGKELVGASVDGNLYVWDINTKEPITTLTGHKAAVWSVSWNPTGRWLASAGEDNTIRLWNTETWENVATLTGHTAVIRALAWSPDGQRLASGSDDGTARVWHLEADKSVQTLTSESGFVLDAKWGPDGQGVAWINHDTSSIQLWNTESGTRTTITTEHTNSIQRIAWSPDGRQLATAAADQTVQIYDANTARRLTTSGSHTDAVSDIAWSPDGKHLASSSYDDTVRIWDVPTGQVLYIMNHDSAVNAVAWSPDGRWIASASSDKTVREWEASTGQSTRVLTEPIVPVVSIAWSRDGSLLAAGASDGLIHVWKADTGQHTATLTGHNGAVWSVAWSPTNPNLLASASNDETVRLWNVATGETIAVLTGHTGAVRAVSWSPDGRRLATAGELDHSIIIYYTDFEQDVLPIARAQLAHGSTPEERQRCISEP